MPESIAYHDDPEFHALVRGIAAAPVESTLVKLVAADWLDERGFAVRANYVRLACGFFDDVRPDAQDRCQALLALHAAAWCAPLTVHHNMTFTGGFMVGLAAGAKTWRAVADDARRVHPLRSVSVTDTEAVRVMEAVRVDVSYTSGVYAMTARWGPVFEQPYRVYLRVIATNPPTLAAIARMPEEFKRQATSTVAEAMGAWFPGVRVTGYATDFLRGHDPAMAGPRWTCGCGRRFNDWVNDGMADECPGYLVTEDMRRGE